MDYRQEAVATLHDFGSADPPAPLSQTAVIVPVTHRDFAGLAPERVFRSLESLEVASVLVPLRAPAERMGAILDWLESFDLPMKVLWCNAPPVADLLADASLDGRAGKGSDVWLALGLASEYDYVALHDADVRSHEPRDIRKLVAPLANGYEFVKAYYARVEHNQLYGRLYRLFFAPLVAALREAQDADVLRYLDGFRYALAGEMAMTGDLAGTMRIPRRWGLEIGTMGEAYQSVGYDGSSQVDLGMYEHDHRAVSGPTGLSDMSHGVARALFRVLEDTDYAVAYDSLQEWYRRTASRFVDQYAADARFNGLEYDAEEEREQIAEYTSAIAEPEQDDRLPTWNSAPLSVSGVESARQDALAAVDEQATDVA